MRLNGRQEASEFVSSKVRDKTSEGEEKESGGGGDDEDSIRRKEEVRQTPHNT